MVVDLKRSGSGIFEHKELLMLGVLFKKKKKSSNGEGVAIRNPSDLSVHPCQQSRLQRERELNTFKVRR